MHADEFEELFVICECSSSEHVLRFSYEKPEYDKFGKRWEDGKIYASVFLRSQSFWKRLKDGIKYIFGYTCRYGHFEETIINQKNAKDLSLLLKKMIQENESIVNTLK